MKLKNYIVYGIGVAAIATLIYTNVRVLNKLNESEVNYSNETVAHHKADSINALYLAKLNENQIVIDSITKDYKLSLKENARLDSLLKATVDSIDIDVPFDSSYAYLDRKYPAVAEKNYNFDGLQVKQFHKLDVSNLYKDLQIFNLKTSLIKCDTLNTLKDKQLSYYKLLYNTCEDDRLIYKSEALKFEDKYNKTKTKLDKAKLARNVSFGGLLVFIVYEGIRISINNK